MHKTIKSKIGFREAKIGEEDPGSFRHSLFYRMCDVSQEIFGAQYFTAYHLLRKENQKQR